MKTQNKIKSHPSVAVIVPAVNEQLVIGRTIERLLKILPGKDIYVVDDGSKDKTAKVASKYPVKLLSIPNRGKAGAINAGIKHFRLISRYRYIMPIDADTRIDAHFFDEALSVLRADRAMVAVVGKVIGQSKNWLTAYRLWEYEIGQSVHKAAQGMINGIVVCPGCATVYRSRLFKLVQFPEGTWTEDMDLTFMIHRQRLGRIGFAPRAYAYTQDPATWSVMANQLWRWYMGFWQNVVKHQIPWGGQLLDAEAALAGTEGLFNALIALIWIGFLPFGFYYNPVVSAVPLLLDLCLFLIPSMGYVAWKHRQWFMFKYLIHFYIIRLVSSWIFLMSFVRVVWGLDMKQRKLWDTQRYAVATATT